MNFFLLTIFSLICSVYSEINSTSDAVGYLSKFGYISELESRSGNLELEKFLLKFQEFFKLKKTGKLDKNTLTKMNEPRCGNPDFSTSEVDEKKRYRRKRYTLQGSSWRKNHISWTITKFSKRPNLRNKSKQIIRAIDKAFSYWSQISGLKFSYTTDPNADIEVRFEKGDHKDGSSFDGPNNTLAHAFWPKYGGAVHFDDDEDWAIDDSPNGVHLTSVALHEIGHSLGLSHSNVENSIMYPTYDGIRTRLTKDDIDGIQKLYGANDKDTTSYSKPKKENDDDNEDICDNFEADAGLCYKPHYCIVFKGNYIYKFKTDGNGIANGYPKKINEIFLGIEGPIDASFKEDNKMFLIKKENVYEYEKFYTRPLRVFNFKKLIPGFKWNENYKQIDAIYKKKRTGNIYIFSGDYYWRFNRENGLSQNYPRPISFFDNLPSSIDLALPWDDNETIFFKGNDYWVYDEKNNRMKNKNPNNVLTDLLKCKKY